MKKAILSTLTLVLSLQAHAQAKLSFADLLQSLAPTKKQIVSEIPELNQLLQAGNLQSAQALVKNKLLRTTGEKNTIASSQVLDLVKRRQMTLVIVPGVLGEFIDTRAFEEIFSRPSSFAKRWSNLVAVNKAQDQRFSLDEMKQIPVSLGEVVNAASIDDASGQPLVKLVILRTILGSMESIGDNASVAQGFNRRLQKYMALTGDQNIVLMGYSRGTPLALEMVTQAKASNLSYLNKVKALVSYAGVVSGSSLADATGDLSTDNGKMFAAAIKFGQDLQFSESAWDRPFKFANNTKALTDLALSASKGASFDAQALLASARSGDSRTIVALILQMASEMRFSSLTDFNGHVTRTKKFIERITKAVGELTTQNRVAWWKTHALPRNFPYLSLAASMVDPDNSAIDKAIYNSREGYSDSLDDQSLIANMRTYKQLTGVLMNDSQVAIHQSLFLPKVIASLNPANAGIEFKPLAVLETHHWGVALQVVNKMKDGRLNPFPREKVLLSLAAYLNQ